MALGDPFVRDASGTDSYVGAVHLFGRGGHLITTIDNPRVEDSQFGWAVALGDGFVVIGAPKHDGERGAAYVCDVRAR